MPYPQSTEYQEALQHPRTAFFDAELKNSKVEETPLGLPLALSGGFALTYPMTTPVRKVAVRCFHRQIPSAEQRYAAIAKRLKDLNSPYFVNFDYQQRGINVRGNPFPIVRMDWVNGQTLNLFLDRWSKNTSVMDNLRASFRTLASFLQRAGIAHGDIQNLNILVVGNDLRLIDYDGMYVPPLPIGNGTEVGHKHFQHPQRTLKDFGPNMDRFSFIVVDLSLRALVADPTLYPRFREGGETIVFKANDYVDPANSEIFRILKGSATLRASAENLERICDASISQVPTLEDFLSGKNIPACIARSVSPAETRAKPASKSYISAFDVFSTDDFVGVMRSVGNKIELVGRIREVKHGVGKRGRGKGKPYTFINFAPWRGDIVKLTIWSEGLTNMSKAPSTTWVGRWVSVTGLVDPPYKGHHYGYKYTHVGITLTGDGQVQFISEAEAQYRLGRKELTASSNNRDVLHAITGKQNGKTPSKAASAPFPRIHVPSGSKTSTSSNQNILNAIRSTPTAPTATTTAPSKTPTIHTQQKNSRSIPWWVWIIGFFLLLWVLSHMVK